MIGATGEDRLAQNSSVSLEGPKTAASLGLVSGFSLWPEQDFRWQCDAQATPNHSHQTQQVNSAGTVGFAQQAAGTGLKFQISVDFNQ